MTSATEGSLEFWKYEANRERDLRLLAEKRISLLEKQMYCHHHVADVFSSASCQVCGMRGTITHDEWVARQSHFNQLVALLKEARGYVAEPGAPGTVVETTEESAIRSAALLERIDEALKY